MPTGYTADVESGKVTGFRQFALKCARAFGACVEMRDDDIDKLPPEDGFKPSSYHAEQLAKAQAEKAKLLKMTDAKKASGAEKQYQDALEFWQQTQDNYRVVRSRYEAMLAKSQAWTPPTEEHNSFKTFMIEQLQKSIRSDVHDDNDEYNKKPVKMSPEAWFKSQVKSADRDIEYHAKHNAEDIERASGRSKWIKDLYASLKG